MSLLQYGSAPRSVAAVASILGLIACASTKTILTKLIFIHIIDLPIAYSLLSASTTVLLAGGSCIALNGSVPPLRGDMLCQLLPVCAAITIDFALSNVAISQLPLALQQAIASTIAAATILLETIVTQRCKPLSTWLVIITLCIGAVLSHLSSVTAEPEATRGAMAVAALLPGELAMFVAIFAAAAKYVFAKSMLHAFRQELGALPLLFWIEVVICATLLPWALLWGELQALYCAGYGVPEWASLASAAALGGVRFFMELLVLRYWSATTLSAANLSAHSFVIVVWAIVTRQSLTPSFVAGTLVTIGASVAFAWLKVSRPALGGEHQADAARIKLVLA